jgi:putative RNA 2'-phosphotransferase
MDDKRAVKISKFLSLVLRHQPEKVGITLDAAGWVGVRDLLDAMARHGFAVGEVELKRVVETSDKKRFAFSEDRVRIRASQGHSVEVELGYEPTTPPDVLYHGTAPQFLESIRARGLLKGQRHHVHLSRDVETAAKVGDRRGKAVILTVDAVAMARDGFAFFVSANGVWLTDHVPAKYIEMPKRET